VLDTGHATNGHTLGSTPPVYPTRGKRPVPPPNTAKAAAAEPLGPIVYPSPARAETPTGRVDYRRNYAPTQSVVKAGRLELRPEGRHRQQCSHMEVKRGVTAGPVDSAEHRAPWPAVQDAQSTRVEALMASHEGAKPPKMGLVEGSW